jgi:hypothetical protein
VAPAANVEKANTAPRSLGEFVSLGIIQFHGTYDVGLFVLPNGTLSEA